MFIANLINAYKKSRPLNPRCEPTYSYEGDYDEDCYCPKCDEYLREDFSYCPYCGQSLDWDYYPKRPSLLKRISHKLFGKKKKSLVELVFEEFDL